MSTWAGIEFDGMSILETQNYLDQWYFRKSDRLKLPPPEDRPEGRPRYIYRAPAKTIARRLALNGNDFDFLKQDFKKQLAQMVQHCKEMLEIDPDGKCTQLLPVLEKSTLDDWLARVKRIRSEGLKSSYWAEPNKDYGDALLNFMLSEPESYYFSDRPGCGSFHFPCTSPEMYAVALLQVVPEGSHFVLDATDMISAGWSDEFDDFIEYHQNNTTFYEVFKTSLTETLELAALAPENGSLTKILYANVITIMETYLSDTLRKQVLKRDSVLRRFVKNHDAFKNSKKEPISEIFAIYDRINELVNDAIDGLSFHNVAVAKRLYKEVLATSFPDEIDDLFRAVDIRHDIVHRNGKDTRNNATMVTRLQLHTLAQLVDNIVGFIDKQIKDGLLEDDELLE